MILAISISISFFQSKSHGPLGRGIRTAICLLGTPAPPLPIT